MSHARAAAGAEGETVPELPGPGHSQLAPLGAAPSSSCSSSAKHILVTDDRIDLVSVCADPAIARENSDQPKRKRHPDWSDEVFFRITHTGLGRHKVCNKGFVTQSDLGAQVIRVEAVRTEGSKTHVQLSLDVGTMSETKLATWMSDRNISSDDMIKHMKQWTIMHRDVWNWDTIDVCAQIAPHLDDGSTSGISSHECKRLLQACAVAKAYGGSKHDFVLDTSNPQSTKCMSVLLRSGLALSVGGDSYRFHGLCCAWQQHMFSCLSRHVCLCRSVCAKHGCVFGLLTAHHC